MIVFLPARSQTTDSSTIRLSQADTLKSLAIQARKTKKSFPIKQLVAPTLMVMYGIGGLESKGIQTINGKLKKEIYTERLPKKCNIDNYLIFAPAATVYGLNALGIKGKHNFRDRSMIYLMSNLFMSGIVFSVKNISHELRPDASDYYSFPSGHTAASFVGAEFLRQEYKDVSPWYGVAGYAMATTTAYLRMQNNKHWLSDVVAGAGIGIASTKLAYWLYPKLQRKLFKDKPMKTIAMPSFQNGTIGIGLVHKF
ncbi:MAG TPA: phosphatase PAP2 family protein [Chitinophagaceae bacterium]|nr:phosphatase PAP2 family protein [Chitinophagaceae bacterium]